MKKGGSYSKIKITGKKPSHYLLFDESVLRILKEVTEDRNVTANLLILLENFNSGNKKLTYGYVERVPQLLTAISMHQMVGNKKI